MGWGEQGRLLPALEFGLCGNNNTVRLSLQRVTRSQPIRNVAVAVSGMIAEVG